ncbi:MAG: hypothetical protein HKN45_09945 [Flavobacteriales bacterium]|nr:hypothetical protein [Flavobacteriales bacterium]
MNDLKAFFEIGLDHIWDPNAYDHLLFIASLLIVYRIKEIKEVILALTAFTLGHAISLLISVFGIIPIGDRMVEFLIPITIVLMSAYHLIFGKGKNYIVYLLTTVFGSIHGLAYAKDLIQMLSGSMSVTKPLLGFNLGVEVAQIIFGFLFLLVLETILALKVIEQKALRMFIFGVILTLAFQLVIQNRIW